MKRATLHAIARSRGRRVSRRVLARPRQPRSCLSLSCVQRFISDAFSETSLDFSEADWREMVEREGLEPELSPLEVAEGSSLDVAKGPVKPSEGSCPGFVA